MSNAQALRRLNTAKRRHEREWSRLLALKERFEQDRNPAVQEAAGWLSNTLQFHYDSGEMINNAIEEVER